MQYLKVAQAPKKKKSKAKNSRTQAASSATTKLAKSLFFFPLNTSHPASVTKNKGVSNSSALWSASPQKSQITRPSQLIPTHFGPHQSKMSTAHQFGRRHSSAIPHPTGSKLGHHIHHAGAHSINGKHPEISRSLQTRRISEGETARYKDMFKCNSCGKSYKHTSSLAKHLWEHTPEWRMTKKLLISKHQQVQLLEAASILVGMNEPGVPADVPSSPFSRSVPHIECEYTEEELQFPGESIPSSYSPMPGYVGGYIDVPNKKKILRMTSISDISGYSDVLKEEEEEGLETPKTRSEEDSNEDEEIVGKME